MACIYCPNDADAREHWLPRGLGRFLGYSPLLGRLCDRCNKALGRELDEEFLRTGATGLFRSVHGVRGRADHTPVSPFTYRAASRLQPTTLLMPGVSPGRVLGEVVPRERVARPIRQVVVRREDGDLEPVAFPMAWTAQQLIDALTAKGLRGAELSEVYLGDDEGPEDLSLRRVLSTVFGKFSATAHYSDGTPERSTEPLPIEISAGITVAYLRALAKNALHYTLWANPDASGDDVSLEPLKRFVRWGAGEWRHFIDLEAPHFVPPFRSGRVPTLPMHVFSSQQTGDRAFVLLHYFVAPGALMPPVKVTLSQRPLDGMAPVKGHVAQYYERIIDGHDGQLTEAEFEAAPRAPLD